MDKLLRYKDIDDVDVCESIAIALPRFDVYYHNDLDFMSRLFDRYVVIHNMFDNQYREDFSDFSTHIAWRSILDPSFDFAVKKWFRKERMREIDELTSSVSCCKGFFITINPKPDTSIIKFYNLISKQVLRNFMVNPKIVFEQRGSNSETLGNGMHCHILIERAKVPNICPSSIQQKLFKALSSICGNIQHIDVKVANGINYDNREKYIQGKKIDDSKKQKVAMDRIWRQKNNLLDIYNADTIQETYVSQI